MAPKAKKQTSTENAPKGAQDETLKVSYAEIRKDVTVELAEATEVLDLVRRAEISTAADYEFAGGALKEVACKHDTIEERRDDRLVSFKAVVKNITSTFKPVLDAYAESERIWKDKIGSWAIDREAKRSDLLKRASRAFEADKKDEGQALVREAEDLDVPKLEGVSVATKWTGEVIDAELLIKAVLEGKVSSEVLAVNTSALLALTEARQGDPEIPGWKVSTKAAVRTSRKGGS
jgi:hypothetical protein